MLCRHARGWIEELSGFQHGAHDDSQLSRDSHGSSFEVNPLSQLKHHVRNKPCTENDRGRFVYSFI